MEAYLHKVLEDTWRYMNPRKPSSICSQGTAGAIGSCSIILSRVPANTQICSRRFLSHGASELGKLLLMDHGRCLSIFSSKANCLVRWMRSTSRISKSSKKKTKRLSSFAAEIGSTEGTVRGPRRCCGWPWEGGLGWWLATGSGKPGTLGSMPPGLSTNGVPLWTHIIISLMVSPIITDHIEGYFIYGFIPTRVPLTKVVTGNCTTISIHCHHPLSLSSSKLWFVFPDIIINRYHYHQPYHQYPHHCHRPLYSIQSITIIPYRSHIMFIIINHQPYLDMPCPLLATAPTFTMVMGVSPAAL